MPASIVTGLQSRLKDNELVIANLLADTNYANGYNYGLLEQKGITGWVPVFGKYKAEIEGFSYNKEKDEYSCPMNKLFPFKGFYKDLDGSVFKNYLASEGLQGLPEEIQLYTKHTPQKDHQNDLR